MSKVTEVITGGARTSLMEQIYAEDLLCAGAVLRFEEIAADKIVRNLLHPCFLS